MNEEELKKLEYYLKSLPTIKQNMSIPVTTNFGINLDDLMETIKQFKKVTTYDELLKENQQLKEQVKYLRRSIERKESTIIELEQEKVPYTNEYVEKLEKANKEAIELINKVINMRKNGYSYEQYKKYLDEILDILDINKGDN